MDLILYFYIFSFFGWILETVYASLIKRKFVSKQTLLKSPLCPIYGLGGVLMLITLLPVRESRTLVFCGGFFVASGVEYLVALYYDRFFGVAWWDYSHKKGNVDGKICVTLSLIWGLIAIFFFEIIYPFTESIVSSMSGYMKTLLSAILTIYFLKDYKDTIIDLKKYSRGEKSLAENKFAALRRINVSKM